MGGVVSSPPKDGVRHLARTVIAEGLQIIGNLSGTADIDVSGQAQGDIEAVL